MGWREPKAPERACLDDASEKRPNTHRPVQDGDAEQTAMSQIEKAHEDTAKQGDHHGHQAKVDVQKCEQDRAYEHCLMTSLVDKEPL